MKVDLVNGLGQQFRFFWFWFISSLGYYGLGQFGFGSDRISGHRLIDISDQIYS